MKRRILRLGARLVIIYAGLITVLALLETTMIYPAPIPSSGNWSPPEIGFEEAEFQASDGTLLHGRFLPHPAAELTILFCHGNGEHVGFLMEEADELRHALRANVMIFDYRGYGRSQGKPTEQGVLQDSQAALNWLLERTGLPASGVVAWGRSLGGAAAVDLAAQQPLKALLLDRTFSSLVEVAAAKFPWAPVRLLLRNRYPSQTKIASYRGPLLQIHGQIDRVVPYRLGRKLFDACPSTRKRFVDSATLDHNDAWDAAIFDRVQDFLTEVAKADGEP